MRLVVAVVAFVACLHAAMWAVFQTRATAPDVDGPLASMSYAPFEGIRHPDDIASRPTAAQIRRDLKAVAPYTKTIRTYSSTGGLELVPQIAAELGLKVTLGIWIDKNTARNEREIRSAIDLARRHRNVVNALVVGNETTLRGELGGDEDALRVAAAKAGKKVGELKAERNVEELMKIIARVKRQSPVPVTTGETWDIWRDHPQLASSVDFIGAHILPYWDRATAKQAVDHTIELYETLRRANPGKKVVIAEFGWPSAGYNRGPSEPGRFEQAAVLREFVARADALGIDYNVIEAFDQPWKTFEGSVGAYWGLFDTNRDAKFAWSGVITDPEHWKLAVIAVLVGLALSLPILSMATATLPQAAVLAVAANAVGAWVANVFAYWTGHYFVLGAGIALVVGILLLIPLVVIALARIDEIAAILFGHAPRRLITSPPLAPVDYAPKVSIHIPAYREQPEMLKQTLDAVARLDYPNVECVVVINNTPDPAYWQPIEEHCRALGDRFKFVRADNLAGFKAGALRLAMVHTAADAEILGVIDADYAVTPDWLKDLVPAFANPKVGLVQAPQEHRDGDRSVMHYAMNGEYAGFFDIGMVQRNEDNAIIVHGTMCLVRRTALEQAGGWSSDTICEDSDLGLTVMENGWRADYTSKRYGYGLLPDTYEAFKKQRHRWAYGGVQIVKKHWREFLPGVGRLTPDQKREFLVGWLNWLGAESVGVVVALLNLAWVPVVAFLGIAVPDKILTLPIMAAFVVTMAHFAMLYRARVAVPLPQMLTAMFAAMSVQWTVARAVGDGVIKDHLPFAVTAKGGKARKGTEFQAFWEAVIGGLLLVGAVVVYVSNKESVREINLFAVVLVLQSLPFLSAVLIALIEGSRLNDLALWRGLSTGLATRLAGVLPQRAAITKPPVAADNRRIETVQ